MRLEIFLLLLLHLMADSFAELKKRKKPMTNAESYLHNEQKDARVSMHSNEGETSWNTDENVKKIVSIELSDMIWACLGMCLGTGIENTREMFSRNEQPDEERIFFPINQSSMRIFSILANAKKKKRKKRANVDRSPSERRTVKRTQRQERREEKWRKNIGTNFHRCTYLDGLTTRSSNQRRVFFDDDEQWWWASEKEKGTRHG